MARKMAGLIVLMIFWGLQASSTARLRSQVLHPPSGQYSASIRSIYCQCDHYGMPCTEIAILGNGFGAREVHADNTRRTRVVVIDGQVLKDPQKYLGWSDGHIACDIDDFVPIVVNRVYKFAIGEIIQPLNDPKNQTLVMISSVFSFRYLIKWNPNSPPQSGHHGDVIQEIACGVTSPQGDLVLMIGSTQVSNVISWGNPMGYVIFEVPSMPPGKYNLHIRWGAEVVSTYKAFTYK